MANEIEDTSPEFELGDGVYIEGGRLSGTRGRIYYIDDDRIRILPMGVSDRLIEINIVEGELDHTLSITNFYQTSKRATPAFVAQIDAHKGQIAQTFGMDGTLGIEYTIEEINEAEDTMTLTDATGGEKTIEFGYKGIPLEEGFAVLRPVDPAIPFVDEGAPQEPVGEGEDLFEDTDLDVPAEDVGLVERPATQRTYPDIVQRNEMFQNLLEMLSVSSQKNVKRQRDIRQLVEQLLLLRNEVVKYNRTGEPAGKYSTSYQTIAELLEKSDIPLARPILSASRSLYLEKIKGEVNPTELPGVDVDIQYLRDVLDKSNYFLESQLGGTTGQILTPDALPQWFIGWESFFKRFMRTWATNGGPGELVTFRGDKEFLRAPLPNGIDPIVDGLVVIKDFVSTVSLVGKVKLSLLKGLGPRTVRLKEKEPPRRIESGDEGIIVNQLLFPLDTQHNLGLIRSGRLSKDITFGQIRTKNILTIISELGGVPEEASAGGILSIGEGGNTSGNVAIEDWIRAQPLHIKGLGDALVEMKNLGLTQKELTIDQQEVLIEKIKQYRALLKQNITNEREKSEKAITELRLENMTFLQGEALEEFMAILQSEPLIASRIEELRLRIPAYRDNDIGLVSGIAAQMYELLLTSLAGIPAPLARARNRRVRDQFLEALRQALLKAEKKTNAGEIPQPIQCPHVESLDAIRKVKNDDERMQLLSRLLARFRGPIRDNWVLCSASTQSNPHNLMCYHEFLQLQEYLHPREKDTLHKELLLKFSGGTFHGRFMCKNCGQPISDMEFDQSMEFDDEGRPMANRATLVDKDAVAQEDINLLLGAPVEGESEIVFATDTQTLIYKTARQVFDKLGIYGDMDSYRRIVERVESDIQKQPSREEFAKLLKMRKGEGKALDYDVLINRILVSSVGAHSLIEIQSHIPDFIIRSKIPGCVAGFSGYPIGKEEDKTGVNYVSCAISTIQSNEPPWNLTGFFAQSSEKKRQDMIAASVLKLTTDAMKTAVVQQMLSVKRAHYEKVYGSSTITDRIPESIPAGFLPVPYFVTAEEATQAVVVPEAAGPQESVRAWIQTAHRIARENGTYVRGSPYSETSCCYTSITDPRSFWNAKMASMSTLPLKQAPLGQITSQVSLAFTPRRMARLLADPPEELFYRVFLRVCYDGPRKGYPHEPGYTNICIHCGFKFSEDPYIESSAPPLNNDLFKEWQIEMNAMIMKGKDDLQAMKVIVDKGTFENVLDATHLNYHIDMPKRKEPLSGEALLGKLLEIRPEPFEGFRQLLSSTMDSISRLPANPDEIIIAEAYGPMSNYVVEILGDIQRRLGAPAMKSLESLIKQSPSQIVESIRTYFLVPFQRLILKFKPETMRVQKSYDLPLDVEEDINESLYKHIGYLTTLQKAVKDYTMIKLEQAKRQLAAVLPVIQKEIRSKLVPGAALGTGYLVGTIIIGILGEFINPNVIPSGVSGTVGSVETNARVPLNILEVCLSRLQLEGLNLTDAEIQDLIARRNDAEKILFVTRQDRMTPEEKKSDMMMKRLGIGEWARGGTKGIYSLDADQYDHEREQRIQMGLGDFVTSPEDAARAAAALYDDAYGGGGEGAEGGYDMDQTGADDF